MTLITTFVDLVLCELSRNYTLNNHLERKRYFNVANTNPKEFYAEKGLKRTTITLRPSTVEFLGSKAKQFTQEVKIATQGELVDVMAQLYATNPQFAEMMNQGMMELLANKEVQKVGRKEGWRKVKIGEA